MKKLNLLLLALFLSVAARAQFEIKVNPIALLFEGFIANGELIINDNIGVEGTVFFAEYFGIGLINGKYYFNPQYGADRFHAGAFLGGGNLDDEAAFGLGFMAGHKWVSSKGVIFDIGLGIGRVFQSDYYEAAPYANASIGYRFRGKNK